MNEITTLFTAIGDFFTKSAWYPMVKLPFWTLLFTVAAGGVYCARFGKKSLLNQGISSTLCIVSVYMGAILLCTYVEGMREKINLPFLAISKESAILVDPLSLKPDDMGPILLKFIILVFLINTADSFGSGGKSIFNWFVGELVAMGIALGLYVLILSGVNAIVPWVFSKYAIIPVTIIFAVSLMLICMKFFFTKIFTKGNDYYTKMNKFFTENRMGTLLTTTGMCLIFCSVLLFILHGQAHNVVTFATSNRSGLVIILAMVLLVQFIFEMFYQDRKKNGT